MPENVYNYGLHNKTLQANKWWLSLPEITRIAIWEDLRGIEDAPVF